MKSMYFFPHFHFASSNRSFVLTCFLACSGFSLVTGQVVDVQPVFPKVHDDITVTFNAIQGNGALTGISPVYAHAGLITSESNNPSDWKHVQGVWGTPDPNVLMTSLGNNLHSISYNIYDFYGVEDGEVVESLAFVFRNANGSIVGRAGDGADIFYPVYPDDVEFQSLLLTPQEPSLALFEGEIILVKGATSQPADLYIIDNEDTLATGNGTLIQHNLQVPASGNHNVRFVAVRGADTLVQSFFYTVIVSVVTQDPPPGRDDGLTLPTGTSAYFQLYAPGKSFVHLIGDVTSWAPQSDFQMRRSVDGDTWWLEVNDLIPGETYRYQYLIDGTLRIGDPYSTLVLDPFNDGSITEETYPDMPQYPYGNTTGIVSCFVQEPVTSIAPLSPKIPKSDLIIYELLLRDFLHAHSYQVLMDTLDYLQRLGVNAIELMPVNEYEGNVGWGYNPSYHMALDKYYGPADTFKDLIEECHARGMAVIIDVVYNHAFGQSPLAQLYWDGAQNRPSADNPWLNPIAKHDFNVGSDFNHESAATKYFVKRVMTYWMETFGIDGFRFDLAKGFTQNNTLGNSNAWAQYDQSRINILQEYADHVWSIDSEAYFMLEHFTVNEEETELSSRGMMIWGKNTTEFSQASMGYGGSDLSKTWHVTRGWAEPHLVAFMESHDEERIMYRNLTNGNSAPGYNIRELNTALSRIELISPFFFLIPGPKMIWAFGELGYDYSINHCEDGSVNTNCRLAPKPIRWDYLEVMQRRRIYDVVRALNQLRQQAAWKEGDLTISLVNQFEKKLHIRHPDMDIAAVGNFNIGARTISPAFTKTGWWYDYLAGDSLWVNQVDTSFAFDPGEYHIYTTKRVDLGFDITTSIRDLDLRILPLTIMPTLHQGQFVIQLPEGITDIGHLEIADFSGRTMPAKISRKENMLEVSMENPVSGIYVVQLYFEDRLYTGKMIVQD